MKRCAVLLALVSLGIVGCQTQADRNATQKAEWDLKRTLANNFRDLNDQKHVTYVEAAGKLLGEQAGQRLAQCYEDGYDSVQNDDHTFANDPKLGPRYVAGCDKIAKSVDKYFDKAEKAHQNEISR